MIEIRKYVCFHYLGLDGVNDRDDHQGNLQHQEHGDDHRSHRRDPVQVPHLRLLEQPNYHVCQYVRIILSLPTFHWLFCLSALFSFSRPRPRHRSAWRWDRPAPHRARSGWRWYGTLGKLNNKLTLRECRSRILTRRNWKSRDHGTSSQPRERAGPSKRWCSDNLKINGSFLLLY